jgi:hypothetical protein
LPDLQDTEIALIAAATSSLPVKRLAAHIVRSLEQAEA